MTNDQTKAFCTQCGTAISSSARFCRACGAPQQPLEVTETAHEAATIAPPATATSSLPSPPPVLAPTPPPPPLPPVAVYPQSSGYRTGVSGASILAVSGGLGMLLLVLCATVYYPLHYHFPFNYGEPLLFGDVFVFGAAVAALTVGIRALRGSAMGTAVNRGVLLTAGVPVLVLTVLWAWSETFHLTAYPQPFYAGFVYFTELGQAHIGSGYLQVPLAAASIAVILAGLMRSN